MRLLLDTHLLIWLAAYPERLSAEARALLQDAGNVLYFSAASIWEIAIKAGLGREDFRLDVRTLRNGLLDGGCEELAITGRHALALDTLPKLHRDPFDRLLVAQSHVEGMTLLTSDPIVACYPGQIRAV